MVKKMFLIANVLLCSGVMHGGDVQWRENSEEQSQEAFWVQQLQDKEDEICALQAWVDEAGGFINSQSTTIQSLQAQNAAMKDTLQRLKSSIWVIGSVGAVALLRCWLKQCGECQ